MASTAGLQLHVVALSPSPRPVHADSLRALGIPVTELGLGRWDPRAVTRTISVLRSFRPHLIHTHLKHADLVGAVAGAALRVPVVSTLHVVEDAPEGALARSKRAAGLVARRRSAARTIALSLRQREWYRELNGSEDGLVVLPNGVADPGPADPARRQLVRRELGAVDGRPLIASASLMRPEKGHALLLDAISGSQRSCARSWPWRVTARCASRWRRGWRPTPASGTGCASSATGMTFPTCSPPPISCCTPAWPTPSPPPSCRPWPSACR